MDSERTREWEDKHLCHEYGLNEECLYDIGELYPRIGRYNERFKPNKSNWRQEWSYKPGRPFKFVSGSVDVLSNKYKVVFEVNGKIFTLERELPNSTNNRFATEKCEVSINQILEPAEGYMHVYPSFRVIHHCVPFYHVGVELIQY